MTQYSILFTVWMWELDCEEGWAPKNWCFWTVVLEKTLESPLHCKEIQPVHSEDQPWDFFGRNDAKAETPVLWPPHAKSRLIGKDTDAGRDWGQEKGQQRMRWLGGITDSMDLSLSELGSWWWTGRPGELRFMGSQRVGHDWATKLNWRERVSSYLIILLSIESLKLRKFTFTVLGSIYKVNKRDLKGWKNFWLNSTQEYNFYSFNLLLL